jgi:hypothetical protein
MSNDKDTWRVTANRKRNKVRLTVGVQSFELDYNAESPELLEWMAEMLRKAMRNAVNNQLKEAQND